MVMRHSTRRERRRQIAKVYFAEDVSIPELAKRFNVSRATVYKSLADASIKPTEHRVTGSVPTILRILKTLLECPNMVQTAVATRHRVARRHVSHIAVEARKIGFDV